MKARFHGQPFREKDKWLISFEVNQCPTVYDMLKDKDISLDIQEYSEKRSNDANRYAWKLITMIANVLRDSKENVYLLMLKRYGQSEMVSVLSDIDVRGYFKYYEEVAQVMLQGKRFTHYKVYKGSSEYNTKEMSILIDGIVSEAKELGIETLTPEDLERMKNQWKVS